MSENIPMPNNLITATLDAVADLDPSLLADPHTRVLIELGAQFITEVTDRYGSPAAPRWASGTVETDVLMCYHNGGTDGHTSAGPLGAGVPRGVLQLANAVNSTAGREVIDPLLRAAAFTAACAHDHTQLCGRSLLPEGQGPDRGDERLSAETARIRCLDTGVPAEVADLVHVAITATAFDPETRSQNVDYDAYPDRVVLAQEMTAAADLLSLATRRGPLSSLEMVCESLCLHQRGRLVQQQLPAAAAINNPAWLLDCIDVDPELHAAFNEAVVGQAKFFAGHRYSDRAIRQACGASVDDLFGGRQANAELLEIFVGLLRDGHSPRELWNCARDMAGY
ncbi:hypothetical protein ACQP0C_41765 (plasmid) [Nocardia sp. CA-129566]|uniref:hypothetical protein n=1 Tax=Nocardia sp. CA-129566 TaxID=3239976 RepID=UPI003D97EF01